MYDMLHRFYVHTWYQKPNQTWIKNLEQFNRSSALSYIYIFNSELQDVDGDIMVGLITVTRIKKIKIEEIEMYFIKRVKTKT